MIQGPILYRLVQPDVDILTALADRLEAGMPTREEELEAARELRLLIGRAKVNPYTEGGDILP